MHLTDKQTDRHTDRHTDMQNYYYNRPNKRTVLNKRTEREKMTVSRYVYLILLNKTLPNKSVLDGILSKIK